MTVATDTVRQRIREAAGQLSDAHERIAQYVMEQPGRVAYMSADEFAHEIGVSSATIVRCAQALKYDGFYSLKRALQEEISGIVNPADKVQEMLSHIDGVGDTLQAVVELEITYLQQALTSIPADTFEKAARAIASARKVGIVAPAGAASLADIMSFRLRRFKADVIPITKTGKDLYEDLHWLESGDTLVVFSFLRPLQEAVISLKYARENSVTSVAIADIESSPVLPMADITLVARRGPVGQFHSLVVPNAIVNALILAYAKCNPASSLAALQRFERVRRKYGWDEDGGKFR